MVLRFNEAVRAEVTQPELEGFFAVVEKINHLISEKKIYKKENESNA